MENLAVLELMVGSAFKGKEGDGNLAGRSFSRKLPRYASKWRPRDIATAALD